MVFLVRSIKSRPINNHLRKIPVDRQVELKRLYQPNNKIGGERPVAAALALIKNEADIISYWLAHVCELFDVVYIVDHQSTDGTREFLLNIAESEKKIHLFSFDHPGYFQAEITNQLARMVLQESPNCWLFPLDADEFLDVSGRVEFLSLLNKQDMGKILLLNWQNCVPMYLDVDQRIDPGFPCVFPSQPGIYNKVAIHGSIYLSKCLQFNQGNHILESESGDEVQLNKSDFIKMYHLPIRSMEHFLLKCVQGYIAYSQLPPERTSTGQGAHWKDMINEVLASGVLDANSIRKFVFSYGQPNNLDVSAANIYKLIDLGWKANKFVVPNKEEINLRPIHRKSTFMELAQRFLELPPQYPELQSILQIVVANQNRMADVSLWQKETKHTLMFNKLSERSGSNLEQKSSQAIQEVELLHQLFSMAFTPQENPLISTWEGHIPFLYCFLNYARPRRFVELGSLFGNSYFAACQSSKQLNNSIECIAIDTWIGDEQTGLYNESVFQHFKYILNRDYPNGKYIRDLFANAVKQFDAGSIDLLHIDGLHTYEAVAEDYKTWLHTLSDRGIIMFHDTQEREENFGVWKLWAELKPIYPSFEFEHSHGLGMILVGKNAPNNVRRLFEMLSKPEYDNIVKFFFSNVGKISPIKYIV
jgi:hypothetical protein